LSHEVAAFHTPREILPLYYKSRTLELLQNLAEEIQ